VRARVFEPRFTTKDDGARRGMGLPLCRAIVEDHAGSIALQSAPGEGTRVRIWLPL
jgi:two-component system NtrC family sensor kinase